MPLLHPGRVHTFFFTGVHPFGLSLAELSLPYPLLTFPFAVQTAQHI
jgi:hypothetical protein